MLNSINTKFIILGDGLLNRIKFDITYKYDIYDFFKLRFQKNEILKKNLSNNLYKKIS